MTTKMMTAWTAQHGYVRIEMPEDYLRYEQRSLEVETCDVAREETGWEWFDFQFDQTDQLHAEAHRHTDTLSCFVDVTGGNYGLSTIYIDKGNTDAFFATEYLTIVSRIKALHQADTLAEIGLAARAFIRFGHGESTISEFGTTKDEARNERARLRGLEERLRREKQQSGG